MTSKSVSIKTATTNIEDDPKTYDISVIKKILKREDMQMMIDSDELTTENYFKPLTKDKDNVSYDSNDTRYMLNKRKIDIFMLLIAIGAKLEYVSSGATGLTFKGEIYEKGNIVYEFAMKVAAYPKHEAYGDIFGISRPENAEIMMLRVLSYFVINHQSPHITLPIITFYSDIKYFKSYLTYGHIQKTGEKIIKDNPANEEKVKHNIQRYEEFIKQYDKGKLSSSVSILLSEWANRGDFLDYTKKRYRDFKLIHWKVFFFQILSVLAIIQFKYPSFRHNDLKANNILVHKLPKDNNSKHWVYHVCGKTYKVKNIGYQLKLWDFDFASIEGIVDNIKVQQKWTTEQNITSKQNRYYDMHYFFNTLIKFVEEIVTDKRYIPREVPEFIDEVVPKQYKVGTRVNKKKGRLLVDIEYTTPQKVLETSPFFEEFRVNVKK
jgi:hypothetical protein